jgi:hypothetical protein
VTTTSAQRKSPIENHPKRGGDGSLQLTYIFEAACVTERAPMSRI